MEDSAIKTGSEAGEAAPSTELTARLLRRATEPLGVIDVRCPQQQYARTAGWVAQRFALLDHWRTRYVSDADVAAPGAGYVFAAPRQPLAEPGQTLSNPIQLAHMAKQQVASQPVVGAAASTSPTEQYRVRRRGASPRTEASVDARPDSASPAEAAAATFDSPAGSIGSEPAAWSQPEGGELRAAEIPSITRQGAPTTSELVLPKRLAGSVEAEPETAGGPAEITTQAPIGNAAGKIDISHHRAETPAAAAPAQSPVSVSRVEADPSSLPLRLQRKVNEATTNLLEGRNVTALASSLSTIQMPLIETPASSAPPVLSGSARTANSTTSPLAERTSPTSSGVSRSTAESSTSLPLVQRQAANGTLVTETMQGSNSDPSVAVAAELRASSSNAQSPAMVWRQSVDGPSSAGAFADVKTSSAKSALPLAINTVSRGELRVARQATTTDPTSSTSAESIAPVAATPLPAKPPAQEIDIERLADQVSELIGRRLEIERERRGITRWN